MEVAPYNIVICPPDRVSRRAITTSRQLRKRGGLFSLGRKNLVPHVTIYLLNLPEKNEKKAKERLEKVVKQIGPIKFVSSQYRNAGGGYVSVVYKKNKSIAQLQNKVIRAINPLRMGVIRDKYKSALSKLSRGKRENVRKFGFSDVGKEYHPHLTFTRFRKGSEKILKEIPKQDFSFLANEIGFYHRGEHGTAKELIARFRLRS